MDCQKSPEIRNFRDIGGAVTADGRRVRNGQIFRSSALDGLTPVQQARIDTLGIRLVVDFRSGLERAVFAAPFSAEGVRAWHAGDATRHGAPQDHIAPFMAVPPGDRSPMQALYRTIPFVQIDSFRVLFTAIADRETPLLFHCAAGKDRTGVAAAILLDVLGVPRETILADYRLSGTWMEHTREEFLANFTDQRAILASEAHWHPMLLTDDSYIDAMFDEITRRYGSSRGYLEEALGLTTRSVDRIITHLTR